MEPQTQQPAEDGGGNKAAGGSVSMLCRQSSSRWTPTIDQIRILRELYYDKGIRSPSPEQIQRICLQLKRYGKAEGKNVFYWFQNHKARERQKKRFTSEVHVPMQRSGLVGNGNGAANWKPEDQYINMNNKYSNICQGVSSASASVPASSAGVIALNGQLGNYGGYGSMNMEKSFRDCSISAGGGTGTTDVGVDGSISHNFGSWVGSSTLDPYSSSPYPAGTFFDMKEGHAFMHQEEDHQEIETLPLFPMHGEDVFGNIKTTSEGGRGYGYYSAGGWGGYNGGSRTSLELSLNSCGYNTTNFY